MSSTVKLPKTLIEAVTYFADKNVCVAFLAKRRWTDGVTCPCGSKNVTAIRTRQLWQCKNCRKQFSVKVGTIFEDSPLPLSKWLPCLWLITNAKNGISSCEVARALGVTQKTAWFMLHRIREAMRNGSIEKLKGEVEVDETFIGGKSKNKHRSKRTGIPGGVGKIAVIGAVERGGKVHANVITSHTIPSMKKEVKKVVAEGTKLFSDELAAYKEFKGFYDHSFVNHGHGEYVKGSTHTNTIEGYWSLFKRCIHGTYIHIAPFHADRYLDEQGVRYNLRKGDDFMRFEHVVSQTFGRRLTWNELIGK